MIKAKTTISLIIIASLVALIMLSTSLLTQAADEDTTPTAAQCSTEMRAFMKTKSTEFRTYLEQHFQSKQSNSSLLELSLERFKKYKLDLRTKLAEFSPRASLSLITEAVGAQQCANEVDTEIAKMEEVFKQYFTETSELKATSMLQTKLVAMNKKLNALSKQVADMYGKWEAIQERIPCFIKKCISG